MTQARRFTIRKLTARKPVKWSLFDDTATTFTQKLTLKDTFPECIEAMDNVLRIERDAAWLKRRHAETQQSREEQIEKLDQYIAENPAPAWNHEQRMKQLINALTEQRAYQPGGRVNSIPNPLRVNSKDGSPSYTSPYQRVGDGQWIRVTRKTQDSMPDIDPRMFETEAEQIERVRQQLEQNHAPKRATVHPDTTPDPPARKFFKRLWERL